MTDGDSAEFIKRVGDNAAVVDMSFLKADGDSAEIKMSPKRKVIHYIVVPETSTIYETHYALCNDGSVWMRWLSKKGVSQWEREDMSVIEQGDS